MTISKKMLFNNWLLIFYLMLAGFIIIGGVIIISGNELKNETISTFYNYNIDEKKKALELEINNRLDEISYERNNVILEEKSNLITEMNILYQDILEHTYTQKAGTSSTEDLKKLFKTLVKHSKNPYFAIDSQGELIWYEDDATLEKESLTTIQGLTNANFTSKVLGAKKNADGVFFDYLGPRLLEGKPLNKIVYCKYLPELDLFIGTTRYYYDIEKKLKERVDNQLQTYYENKENYVFVHDYDSTILVTGRKELVGLQFENLESYGGESIHKKIMDLVTTTGSGFVQYRYVDKNNNQLSEKISYVSTLDGWHAYIGTGFYLNSLNNEIKQYNEHFKAYFYNQVLFIIVGQVILSLIVLALVQRGAYMQRKYMEQEDVVFEKLFELSGQAIAAISSTGEIVYQNNLSLQLFENNLSAYFVDKELTLPKANDSVFIVNTATLTHYLRYKCEQAIFKGYESTLFIFEDITSEYLQTHHFETMAMQDAMTKLPNRRALEDDFNLLQLNPNATFVIGILDIDHFKLVNDTYGHQIGDEVLIKLADVFRHRLRHTDQIYRYGGEEFIVILSDVTLPAAKKIIEEINCIFSETIKQYFGFSKTYSCGLVTYNNKNGLTLQDYIQQADTLLYQAKQNGRNRIEI